MDTDSRRQLHTGSSIPVMGLGTWMLTDRTAETVSTAFELGYRLIDTSSDYGTQPGIGAALERSRFKREEVFICTKVEETDDAYLRSKSNLRELGLGFVDLMLIHRPPFRGAGEELWRGLIRAREEGLARDIGVSNYSTRLIGQLIENAGVVPVINQIEWSPFGHSDEMIEYCAAKGIVIQAYSPLTRTRRLADGALARIASRYGKTPAQVLLRWNIQQGYVPIPKANHLRHLEENIDVFDFELGPDDIELLNSLNEAYSSLGTLPYI